jgi:hypothetical protein
MQMGNPLFDAAVRGFLIVVLFGIPFALLMRFRRYAQEQVSRADEIEALGRSGQQGELERIAADHSESRTIRKFAKEQLSKLQQ